MVDNDNQRVCDLRLSFLVDFEHIKHCFIDSRERKIRGLFFLILFNLFLNQILDLSAEVVHAVDDSMSYDIHLLILNALLIVL